MRDVEHGFLWIGVGIAFTGIVIQALSPNALPRALIGVMVICSVICMAIGAGVLVAAVRNDIAWNTRELSWSLATIRLPVPRWAEPERPKIELKYSSHQKERGRLTVENHGVATTLTCTADHVVNSQRAYPYFSNAVLPWVGSSGSTMTLPQGGVRSLRLFTHTVDVEHSIPGAPSVRCRLQVREAGSDTPLWCIERDPLEDEQPMMLILKLNVVGDSIAFGPSTSYWRIQEVQFGVECEEISEFEVLRALHEHLADASAALDDMRSDSEEG